MGRRLEQPQGRVVRDDEVLLTLRQSRAEHVQRLRRVVVLVEVDGVECQMEFLPNTFAWAGGTVAELSRRRWQIEVFFKQITRTLQLADFLANSANGARWQAGKALLVHALLRCQTFRSRWGSSFVRLWVCLRSGIRLKPDRLALLKGCRTARGDFRLPGQTQAACLPGFAPVAVGQPQSCQSLQRTSCAENPSTPICSGGGQSLYTRRFPANSPCLWSGCDFFAQILGQCIRRLAGGAAPPMALARRIVV